MLVDDIPIRFVALEGQLITAAAEAPPSAVMHFNDHVDDIGLPELTTGPTAP